uniref:Transcription elongation factor SPT5 n=1 Tax=Panagrolaimus superbus TaxID=310955 RepID=A0A914Y3Q5_9BILA
MRDQERQHSQKNRFAQMSEAQLAEYFQTRHEVDSAPINGVNEEYYDAITQNGLLPDARSPNLYIVKCRMGEEQMLCVQLMKKYLAFLRTDEPLEIKSVVVKDGIKGMVYIEAYKTPHVLKAIDGIHSFNAYNIKMVPKTEMVDTLKIVKDIPILKAGSYVRVKRTMFKDDLAQVDDIDLTRNEVILKLVPRIDYTKLRGALRGQEGDRGLTRRKGRAPLALFNPDKIRNIGGEFTKDGDFYIFENNRYRNGFLYKYFNIEHVEVDGVKPTISELELFNEGSNEFQGELSVGKDFAKYHSFAPGDTVEVTEGELVNLQGRIQSIENDLAYIKPENSELKDIVTVNIHGHYKGDTGMIVRVEENLVILISDINNEEIKVLPRDLKLSPHVATGVDSHGRFQLHDLVQIDKDAFGVITAVHTDKLTLLTNRGAVSHLKSSQILRKIDSKRSCGLDANKQSIVNGSQIKMLDENNKEAEVLHIYRGACFLNCRTHRENGGILVKPARQVAVLGSRVNGAAPAEPLFKVPQSPRHFLQSPARNSSAESSIGARSDGSRTPFNGESRGNNRNEGGRGGGRMNGFGGGANQPRRNMTMIGKNVRIKGGPYKGHYGIVKDATESTANVELHANCKTQQFDVNRLEVVEGEAGVGANYRNLARTPSASTARTPAYSGYQTPMYGSQTPMHEGFGNRTPHYGGQTPGYDGSRTPSHSSAWDPSALATPAHSSFGAHDDDNDNDDINYMVPTPAVAQLVDESGDDFYDTAPMSVNPFTPAGFSNYEPATPRNDHRQIDSPPPPARNSFGQQRESSPPPRNHFSQQRSPPRNDFSQRRASPPPPARQQPSRTFTEIPDTLIDTGDWCDIDMLINVRRNCTQGSLHGKTLPITRIEKGKRQVIVKNGNEKVSVDFKDILPAPPVEEGSIAQIIFDATAGKLFTNAPPPEPVERIEGNTVVFENGDRALRSHCVAIN